MFKIRIAVIVLFISLQSCDKETVDLRTAEFEPPIITGFNFMAVDGSTIGSYGIPNVKTTNGIQNAHSIGFFAYPNPCRDRLSLWIKSGTDSSNYYIWLVQAKYEDNISHTPPYIANTILMEAGAAPLVQMETHAIFPTLDLSKLNDGYYRVYVKIHDEIYYDNIVVSKSLNQ